MVKLLTFHTSPTTMNALVFSMADDLEMQGVDAIRHTTGVMDEATPGEPPIEELVNPSMSVNLLTVNVPCSVVTHIEGTSPIGTVFAMDNVSQEFLND